MTGKSFVALGLFVLVLAVGCDAAGPQSSPTPFPTLIPLGTAAPSTVPSLAPQPSTSSAPSTGAESPAPEPLALPAEFSKIPKGRGTYLYEPTSKEGAFAVGTPKNLRFGKCGIFMPIDINGSVWDPTYGDDGQGGPLTEDQLTDLRSPGKVTVTVIDENTLLLVTRHGAAITLVPHEGARRYKVCD